MGMTVRTLVLQTLCGGLPAMRVVRIGRRLKLWLEARPS